MDFVAAVVMTVCQATGQPWRLAWRASWAMTLYAYRTIRDLERLEGFRDEDRRIADARRVMYAYHDPKELQNDVSALRRRIRASPNHIATPGQQDDRSRYAEHLQRLDDFAARNAELYPLS